MRLIEFRAYTWDTRYPDYEMKNYIMNVESISWNDAGKMDFIEVPYKSKTRMAEINDVILMQYTGLRDKAGVKIFEGDLVQAWFPGMPNDMRAIQEIMFLDGCFGCGDYPLKVIDKSTLEIIGDIHENPEMVDTNSEEVK